MSELTAGEIARQDFVDCSIFDLICALNPSLTTLDWDIEFIAEIREVIEDWFTDKYAICSSMEFYPYLTEEE